VKEIQGVIAIRNSNHQRREESESRNNGFIKLTDQGRQLSSSTSDSESFWLSTLDVVF